MCVGSESREGADDTSELNVSTHALSSKWRIMSSYIETREVDGTDNGTETRAVGTGG